MIMCMEQPRMSSLAFTPCVQSVQCSHTCAPVQCEILARVPAVFFAFIRVAALALVQTI